MDLFEYFATEWQPRTERYTYSGWALLNKIGKHEHVIDVGCGYNQFKPFLNLIGIDPANTAADYLTSVEDFRTEQRFDVALCLGSLNFGTREQIERQLAAVVALTKPSSRIYWRCNPGNQDHTQQLPFFPWTTADLHEYAARYGYKVTDEQNDCGRIYHEWTK